MLDHVDARVDRHLGVDGLTVAGDLDPEQMRFLDSGAHFGGCEMACDLDDARAFLERLAHHVAPCVGTIDRSEERRVGNECDSKCRSRWSPSNSNTKARRVLKRTR